MARPPGVEGDLVPRADGARPATSISASSQLSVHEYESLSMNMKVWHARKVGQDTWAAAMGLASHPPSQPWGQTQQSSPPRLSLVASVLDIDNVHSANSLAVCLPQNGKIFKSL